MVFERAPISKTYARDVTPGTCDVAGGSAGTKARVFGLAGILVAVSTSLIVGPALLSGSPAATGVPSPPHKPHGGAVPFTPSLGEPESPAAWPRPGHDPDIRRAAPSVDIEAHFSGWPDDDDAAPLAPHTPHGSAMARDTAPQSPKSSRRGAAAAALWPRPDPAPEVRTAVPPGDDEAPPSGTHANDNLPPAPHILRGSAVLLATAPEAPEPARGGIAAAAHGPSPGRDLEIRPEALLSGPPGADDAPPAPRTPHGSAVAFAAAPEAPQSARHGTAAAGRWPRPGRDFVVRPAVPTGIIEELLSESPVDDDAPPAPHNPGDSTRPLAAAPEAPQSARRGLAAVDQWPRPRHDFDVRPAVPSGDIEGLTSLYTVFAQSANNEALGATANHDEDLKALAASLPECLTTLVIHCGFGVTDEGLKALAARLPEGLTGFGIDLSYAKVTDEGFKALAAHLPGGLTILKIDLQDTHVADEGLKALAARLPERLTSLVIDLGGAKVADEGLKALAARLPEGLTNLVIDLRSAKVTDEGLKALAAHLPENLTRLDMNLRYTKVADEGLKALAAHLHEGLKSLDIDLDETEVADEGLKALGARLPEGLTSLVISLHGPEVADEGLKALVVHLPEGLKSLDLKLGKTHVADEGLKALAVHFPHGLKSLDIELWETNVADEGLKALAAHLPEGLQSLDLQLSKTNVADEGLKALAANLSEGLTSLVIRLGDTEVADEGLKALASSLPERLRNLRNFSLELAGTNITKDAANKLGSAVSQMKGLHVLHIGFGKYLGHDKVDEVNSMPLVRDELHRLPIKYCSADSLSEHFFIKAGGRPSIYQQATLVVGAKGTWFWCGIAILSAMGFIATKHTLSTHLVNVEGPHIGYQIAARKAIFQKQQDRLKVFWAQVNNVADVAVLVFVWGPLAYTHNVAVVGAMYGYLHVLPAIEIYGARPVFMDPTLTLATRTERHTLRLFFALRGVAESVLFLFGVSLTVIEDKSSMISSLDASLKCAINGIQLDRLLGGLLHHLGLLPAEGHFCSRVADRFSGELPRLLNPYKDKIFKFEIDTFIIFINFCSFVFRVVLIVCCVRLLSAVVQLAWALIRGCVALIRRGVHRGEEQAEVNLLEDAAADSVSAQGTSMAGNDSTEALLRDGAPEGVPLANATAGDANMEDEAQQLARDICEDAESVDFDKFGYVTLFTKIIPALVDVCSDLFTIYSMFCTENYKFGCILLTVWTVTFFEEISRGPLLCIKSQVRESFETKVTSKLLTEMLIRESGFEAFVSLALTSYAVPFCFQSNESMLIGFALMLLSVNSIATHLHIRVDLKVDVD